MRKTTFLFIILIVGLVIAVFSLLPATAVFMAGILTSIRDGVLGFISTNYIGIIAGAIPTALVAYALHKGKLAWIRGGVRERYAMAGIQTAPQYTQPTPIPQPAIVAAPILQPLQEDE